MSRKHKNYQILNLIGYGLAKFDNEFLTEFGFTTKTSFYKFCVDNGIADTTGTIKNRMDLFDYFFPNNGRRGWWQKGDAYIHRKILIDNLFGKAKVDEYADIVKLYMKDFYKVQALAFKSKPITQTRFKKLQETGLEAEIFFLNNFKSIPAFNEGGVEDARLYGDGYDFQVNTKDNFFLVEVKGIRGQKGKFRLTENEYLKAKEYKNDYVVTVILNLDDIPHIKTIENPLKNLSFREELITQKSRTEYHLIHTIC
jgi:hypothetical protein